MTGLVSEPASERRLVAGLDGRPLQDQVRAVLARAVPTPDGPVLPIVRAGHPLLAVPAASWVGQLDDATMSDLIASMKATMRAAPGVGLAAPQVGIGVALAVVEDPGAVTPELAATRERRPYGFRVLINPSYVPYEPTRVAWPEGCLSVPGYQATRARWRSVRLTGMDEQGRRLDEIVTGWPARIIQHETDHLAGRLYLDGAVPGTLTANGS